MRDTGDGMLNYSLLLQQTYHEALERNEDAQKHWIKVQEEYKSLKSLLRDLPNELSKDVMVPVAPRALMRGKIVHSNEILVCLGQGYFVKRSAAQAAEICQRREKVCSNMLLSLERERELFVGRCDLPIQQDAFGGSKEIIEEYNEENETRWEVEHKERVKEYRQKLAELRTKEKIAVTDEETLWQRLDELELQEELEEELDRLHADDEESEEEDEHEDGEEKMENERPCDTDSKTIDVEVGNTISPQSVKPSRQVIFATNEGGWEDVELQITIKHTTNPASTSDCVFRENNLIQSPAELYTYFKNNFLTKRKSILKKTSSYESDLGCTLTTGMSTEPSKEDSEKIEDACKTYSQLPPVLDDVIEREAAVSTVLPTDARPVSRFKAIRQLKKR